MRHCPTCGKDYDDNVEVCPEDKHPLPAPRTLVEYPPPPADGPVPDPADSTPTPESVEPAILADGTPTLPPAPVAATGPGGPPPGGEFVSGIMDAGTVLGTYRLVKLIGKGGMGEVYLALHTVLGKRVALKLLRSSYAADRNAVRRFFNEAKAACQIDHPNIVAITDFFENEGGSCFYVMEYLEGQSLADRRDKGDPIPLEQAIRIGSETAEALNALHGTGVVHRDLKPGNIFLVQRPEQPEQVKLLDFGLVKLTEEAQRKQFDRGDTNPETAPNMLLGTPEYMAPEQIRQRDVDLRSDIYSLGVVLYEMVVGKRPLEAGSYGELLLEIVSTTPRSPSERGAKIPKQLESLIMACLEKDPDRRPQTAKDVRNRLRALQIEGIAPPPDLSSTAKLGAIAERPRRKWVLPLVVVSLCLFLVAGLIALWPRGKPPQTGLQTGVVSAKPIARLAEQWRDVHRRPRDEMKWAKTQQGMDLFHLDSLRTGTGARAQVKFKVGATMDVDERSEVLIEAPRPLEPGGKALVQVARVKSGTLRGVATPGRPFRFITPDGKTAEIVARGGKPVSFRALARKGGGLELAVLKGKAQVSSGGKTVVLGASQVVDVKKGQLTAPARLLHYPELVAPAVDAYVPGASATLRWRAVSGAAGYRVQVSTFVGFDEKIVNNVVSETEHIVGGLPSERVVWRVASVDDKGHEGEFGFARRFTPEGSPGAESAAEAAPAESAVVEMGRRREPITFRWSGPGKRFELLLGRRPGLKRNIALRKRVRGKTISVDPPRPGVYYWNVFTRDGKRRAIFPKARRLLIRQRTPPKLNLPNIDWE